VREICQREEVQGEVQVETAMQQLNSQLGDHLNYEEVSSMSQQAISALIDTESSARLHQATVDTREQARLNCVARQGAGDWLTALPSKALGLHLRSNEFTTAAKYRLGLPVFRQEGACPLGCEVISNVFGDHAISCAIHGERIAKHNHLRDCIYQAAQQAQLGPLKEPDGLLPGSDDRPADILLPNWTQGRGTALDVTVVNPLQAALVRRTAEEGEAAVQHAHNTKVQKYSDRCAGEGLEFIPMAVDTFGGWHEVALQAITKLGRQLARVVGKEEAEAVRHLRQRAAVLLVRDNVTMMLSRSPTFPPQEIDGDLDI
jgi:hypothetical protein